MRVILPCAGLQTRWRDSSTPKHLVKLCGEPVLHRTVRLVNEVAPQAEVLVVVENARDQRYRIPGSRRATAKLNPTLGDVDKLASSRHLWENDGWTIVLFGDVWWSLPAIRAVFRFPGLPGVGPLRDDWTAFARFGPNGSGGEIFGFVIPDAAYDRFDEAIAAVAKVADAKREDGVGLYRGGVRGGWGVYRYLTGGDPLVHEDRSHYVPIDDWTNDLDSRRDWDEWCWRWAHATDDERARQVG